VRTGGFEPALSSKLVHKTTRSTNWAKATAPYVFKILLSSFKKDGGVRKWIQGSVLLDFSINHLLFKINHLLIKGQLF
jgi:hypothetical protein